MHILEWNVVTQMLHNWGINDFDVTKNAFGRAEVALLVKQTDAKVVQEL